MKQERRVADTNTEQFKRWFGKSKLVNPDGTPKVFYHGSTKGGGFSVFKNWQYFTENRQYAERYTQRGNPYSLYAVYLKMEKPFDTRNAKDRKIFEQMRSEYGLGALQDSGLPDWTDGYDIADFIEENGLDYDGIILDEGGDLVNGKPVSRGLSYVVRNADQIKSAASNIGTFDASESLRAVKQLREGFRSYAKARQIESACEKLSGERLPAFCDGCPDLYIMCKTDGKNLSVGLWNLSRDKIKKPEIRLGVSPSKITEALNCRASLCGDTVTLGELGQFTFCAFTVRLE